MRRRDAETIGETFSLEHERSDNRQTRGSSNEQSTILYLHFFLLTTFSAPLHRLTFIFAIRLSVHKVYTIEYYCDSSGHRKFTSILQFRIEILLRNFNLERRIEYSTPTFPYSSPSSINKIVP